MLSEELYRRFYYVSLLAILIVTYFVDPTRLSKQFDYNTASSTSQVSMKARHIKNFERDMSYIPNYSITT